ncbi:MAG: HAMP domain-containing histidine kinase [Myxococcales bacterium]|nr:HAMP domain-containing histidine kinase [Myxococcales bacterium]
MRRVLDRAALVGASAATVNQIVAISHDPSARSIVTAAIAFGLAVSGLLGLLGRAPWTPVAYIVLALSANVAYLASFGPWFGMGVVYVATITVAFVFMSRRWWWRIAFALVATPFTLGLVFATGAFGASPALELLDVSAWRRSSFAAITAAIGIVAIVSYAVRHLVNARREIEATFARELVERAERDLVEVEISRARRTDQIAELAAEVGAEIGAALAIIETRARALAAELPSEALDDVISVSQSARSTMRSLAAFAPHADLPTDERGNAGDVVRSLPKLVRRTLPARVALEIRADDDAWVGIGANDLTRICANLVLNANDAIADEGTIAVRVTREHERVVIDVQDDGAGMPRDVLSHLFQPFFTTKPIGRGTGLGLATARILVERAEGTIEVKSDVGRGTRFTICLPLVA